MTELQFTEIDGIEYLRMQSHESREILDISKTQFYNDNEKENWMKQDGPRGAVFYFVPREYVTRRQNESKERKEKLAQQKNPIETTEVDQPRQENTIEPSLAENTLIQLIQEKDQRIKEMQDSLENERRLTQEVIKAKESELQTLKATVLVLTSKQESTPPPSNETINFVPEKKQVPLLERLKFWR